jgi:predicted nucleic acid-binding protein
LRRLRPNTAVVGWISAVPSSQLFLSAVTLGELHAGVEITRRQDPTKAKAIEGWIDALTTTHNILPADGVIFRRWAQLMYRKPADLIEDALIAATALVHDMTVATRNVRDFQRLGVPVINPFQRVS